MMRINLLPVKAARKQGSARQELLLFTGVLAVIAAGLFVWWNVGAAEVSDMQDKVTAMRRELETVAKEVSRVEEFKKKAEMLERKLGVIEQLKKKKVGPAKMLDDLATILNSEKKVWLTRLEERDGVLTLEGGAMAHENLSDFQMALSRQSKFFSNVRLVVVSATNKNGVNYVEWKLTCSTNYAAG